MIPDMIRFKKEVGIILKCLRGFVGVFELNPLLLKQPGVETE